jgi:uncharacterized membrane protein
MAKKKEITLQKVLPYIIIICGILGFIASFALTYDKIQVLKDPSYNPNCNINPVLSCGSVMKTEQASLFGVPNTIFGIAGFSVLITVGIMMLAGAKFAKWFWWGLQAGVTAGFFFFVYLFFQGVYRIGAICPWCFVVWMIMLPLFLYVSLYNLREKNITLPKNFDNVVSFAQRYHGDILASMYVVIFLILLTHFWYYWKTLI